MSLRIIKINEHIRHIIAEILSKSISFKAGVLVTVSKTDTSPDLRNSRVFISVFPATEGHYVLTTLKKEMYILQQALNRKLHMNPIPRIHFSLDTTEEEAQKVEDILKSL